MQTLKTMGVTKFTVEFCQTPVVANVAPLPVDTPVKTVVAVAEPVQEVEKKPVTTPAVKQEKPATKPEEKAPKPDVKPSKAEAEAKAAEALAKREAKKEAATEKKPLGAAKAKAGVKAETEEVDCSYAHFIELTELDEGDPNGNALRTACLNGMTLDDLTTVNNDFGLGNDMDSPIADIRKEIIESFNI